MLLRKFETVSALDDDRDVVRVVVDQWLCSLAKRFAKAPSRFVSGCFSQAAKRGVARAHNMGELLPSTRSTPSVWSSLAVCEAAGFSE